MKVGAFSFKVTSIGTEQAIVVYTLLGKKTIYFYMLTMPLMKVAPN